MFFCNKINIKVLKHACNRKILISEIFHYFLFDFGLVDTKKFVVFILHFFKIYACYA